MGEIRNIGHSLTVFCARFYTRGTPIWSTKTNVTQIVGNKNPPVFPTTQRSNRASSFGERPKQTPLSVDPKLHAILKMTHPTRECQSARFVDSQV